MQSLTTDITSSTTTSGPRKTVRESLHDKIGFVPKGNHHKHSPALPLYPCAGALFHLLSPQKFDHTHSAQFYFQIIFTTIALRTYVDALGWLYCARGFYKLGDYHATIEAVTPALRNDRTKKEAQHLLAFSFLHTGQLEAAVGAFFKSVGYGNETDWQPLVEILLENQDIKLN